MRKTITTLLSLALAFATTAQSSAILQLKPQTGEQARAAYRAGNMIHRANTAEGEAIMLPQQEEEWLYIEGEWERGGNYFYNYDQIGNVTVRTFSEGRSALSTQYVYNDNNMVVETIETVTSDGTNYKNSAKRTIAYDPIVTDVITESESYNWTANKWLLVSDGHTYKRVITRNDKGNVTSVEIHTYFMEEYHLQMRSTITYNQDGLAEELKYEELAYNNKGELEMQEVYTIRDMTWYLTDGQILALDDYNWLLTNSHNKMKKGKVYMNGRLEFIIEAKYEENGNYNFSITYPSKAKTDVSYKYTDDNGSYIVNTSYYEDLNADNKFTDDEYSEGEELIVLVDQYGRIIQETAYYGEEILFGAKYDYTYLEEYGSYPTEQVFMDYNFELEEYVPFLKIVGKDFIDVAAVHNTTIDQTSGEKFIYNLNGMRIDAPEEQLPAGIYIIKSDDGKVTKRVIK